MQHDVLACLRCFTQYPTQFLSPAEVEVTVASVGATEVVTCARKTRIIADCKIDECAGKNFDVIALPGGMPGANNLRDNASLVTLLKQQAEAGKLYAAICASPAVVLHHHGLLAGKSRATCYPAFKDTVRCGNPMPRQSHA